VPKVAIRDDLSVADGVSPKFPVMTEISAKIVEIKILVGKFRWKKKKTKLFCCGSNINSVFDSFQDVVDPPEVNSAFPLLAQLVPS
jgi:hypothetical protein